MGTEKPKVFQVQNDFKTISSLKSLHKKHHERPIIESTQDDEDYKRVSSTRSFGKAKIALGILFGGIFMGIALPPQKTGDYSFYYTLLTILCLPYIIFHLAKHSKKGKGQRPKSTNEAPKL